MPRRWRRLHLRTRRAALPADRRAVVRLVTRRNPSFPGFFFVHEHFARFLTTVHQRVEPWWYFLPLLLLGVLPWLAALVHAARSAEPPTLMHAGTPADPRFKPVRFLLVYAAVTLAFFSASGSKLAPYILPMLPVLAALAGIYAPDPQAFVRRAARSGAVLVVVVGAGLLFYCLRRNGYVPHAAAALGRSGHAHRAGGGALRRRAPAAAARAPARWSPRSPACWPGSFSCVSTGPSRRRARRASLPTACVP